VVTGAAGDTGVAAAGAGGARVAVTAPTARPTVAAVVAGTAAGCCAADDVTDLCFTGIALFFVILIINPECKNVCR